MWMDGILKVIAGFFLDIIETVVIALSVFLIVYLIFMQPHQVNGQSMDPTFHDKEYLLTDKITYRRRAPERGEVVVFHAPPQAGCPQGAGCDFIKRILGLPGETVEIKDGGVYVDGKKLDESYLPKGLITDPGMFTRNRSVTLGADEYFVSGDNRPHSSDSRAWGPIKFKEIVGRVFFRYWPPDRAGVISDPVYAK
jgi:signal peptidase I